MSLLCGPITNRQAEIVEENSGKQTESGEKCCRDSPQPAETHPATPWSGTFMKSMLVGASCGTLDCRWPWCRGRVGCSILLCCRIREALEAGRFPPGRVLVSALGRAEEEKWREQTGNSTQMRGSHYRLEAPGKHNV